MALLPGEVRKKTFSIVRGRGYDRGEVDVFLGEVASNYGAALQKIAAGGGAPQDSFEDLGQEVATVLQTASNSAADVKRRAQEEAETIRQSALHEASTLISEAKEELTSREQRASEEMQRLMREAEKEAQDLRESARRRCSDLLGEAERRHEDLQAHERLLRGRLDGIQQLVIALRAEVEMPGAPERRPQRETDQVSDPDTELLVSIVGRGSDEQASAGNGEPASSVQGGGIPEAADDDKPDRDRSP